MKYKYNIDNLECANCAKKVENALNNDSKITRATVNFATSTITIETLLDDPFNYIKKIIKEIEPDAVLSIEKKKEKKDNSFLRLIIGGLIGLFASIIKLPYHLNIIFIIISYIILIYKTAITSFKQLLKKNINENLLVTISCLGAFILGEIKEGLMVIFLYELGKVLESRAVNKSRKSIADLMDIKEEVSNLKKDGNITKVPTETISLGDIIIVKEGEKVPLDGIVISGSANLDTSAITGESLLLSVKENDQVLSGTINKNGLIEVKVTSTYQNSTVSKILNLVETATEKKAKTETFVSKYAPYYTLTVLIIAILVGTLLPFITTMTFKESIYKGLTILVISCPCAIAISVPLSYFSALGRASKDGILIKGSNYIDGIRNIGEIVFDKTGTITTGNFIISKVNIYAKNFTEEEILELYAKGESLSNHPIAISIIKKYNKEVNTSDIKSYKEVSGKGISYTYQNKKINIGTPNFCNAKDNISRDSICMSINGVLVSSLEIEDEIKKNVKTVINSLEHMHITVRMFTGDSKDKAITIAKTVGIENVNYEMLPEDKYKCLEKIIKNKKDSKLVSFVGDGINDAPVLALSDIGISMGSLGSDSAIEASDIVIMNDNLEKIIDVIHISQKTNKIIKENLFFAILVKASVLILSIIGISTMWEAVFADVGVTIICILNTLRLIKIRI